MSEKKERRFERTDFVTIDDHVELLLGVQQARFDKKNFGTGKLSIQEEAEYMGVNYLLDKIEQMQKVTVIDIVKKWKELYNDNTMSSISTVETFNKFLDQPLEKIERTEKVKTIEIREEWEKLCQEMYSSKLDNYSIVEKFNDFFINLNLK